MSDKIVSLQAKRKEKQPHISGEARCLSCKHEWVAVAEIGATWLECPKCGLEMGRYIYHVERPIVPDGEVLHWTCPCGNDLFFITPEHIYCPVCGTEQCFD